MKNSSPDITGSSEIIVLNSVGKVEYYGAPRCSRLSNDTAAWALEGRAGFNTLMIAGNLIYNLEKPI